MTKIVIPSKGKYFIANANTSKESELTRTSGNKTVMCQVDATNVVDESDEKDNYYYLNFQVKSVCGNGKIDAGESCDWNGPNMNGKDCTTEMGDQYAPEGLTCDNNCWFNTNACTLKSFNPCPGFNDQANCEPPKTSCQELCEGLTSNQVLRQQIYYSCNQGQTYKCTCGSIDKNPGPAGITAAAAIQVIPIFKSEEAVPCSTDACCKCAWNNGQCQNNAKPVIPEGNCELMSGTGATDNWNFVIIVEGYAATDKDTIKNKLKFMIEKGYNGLSGNDISNHAGISVYKDKINIKYVYLPDNILDCNAVPPPLGIGEASKVLDCNRDKARLVANTVCGGYDKVIVIPLQTLDENPDAAPNAIPQIDADLVIGQIFKKGLIGAIKDALEEEGGQDTLKAVDVVTSDLSSNTMWHELGHSFAGIVDYYYISDDCYHDGYLSKMCTTAADFKTGSDYDSRFSHDLYWMVREFNTKCTAQLHTQGDSWNVFPNPASKGTIVKIPYAITVNNNMGVPSYCQVTAEVYDITGKLVQLFTTHTAPDGVNYMASSVKGKGYNYFEWDQKNNQGQQVATGAYFARVCAGNCLTYKFLIIG